MYGHFFILYHFLLYTVSFSSLYCVMFLGARISIEGTVMLKKVDNIDFSKLHTFEEVTAAASNSEMVHQLEEVLMMWYKQIEQVRPLRFPSSRRLLGPKQDIVSLVACVLLILSMKDREGENDSDQPQRSTLRKDILGDQWECVAVVK